ncbi:MAG TPA: LytTR family DNA-binding domain-containing protein [Chitinophagaceae bacterium]|nr:LytTR family DNA-binding domain-containing protein [Chitinophagaceae bacterium]
MIKAIAVDDEPLALEVIESFCSKLSGIELDKTFTQVAEAQRYLRKFPVDLLFLDIQMPYLSGIELYKRVEQEPMVIFTTAFPEYAIEGFNLNAIDYILKPYSFERFSAAVQKAIEYSEYLLRKSDSEVRAIFVKADYSLVKIQLQDIQYIEAFADYLKIYLPNKKFILTRMTMKSVTERLPVHEFIRVHRSFIVPLKHIKSVRNKIIQLPGVEIPIGNSYEEELFRRIKP